MRAVRLARAAIFAALYAALTLAVHPIAYMELQLRVSDALIPLSAIFGPEVAAGTALGCVVANALAPYGINPLDMTLGPAANLIASLLAYRLRRRLWLAALAAALVVGLIVGGYLWVIVGTSPWFTIASVTASSLVSVGLMGYLLARVLTSRLPARGSA